MKSLSCIRLFETPWTITYQAPLFMGFSRQEYWSGLPFPSPGDLPDPRIEPGFPTLQIDTLLSEPPGKPELRGKSTRNVGSIWDQIYEDQQSISMRMYKQECVLLLLNHFSRVQLCATPQTAGHEVPPSLGFSRQEHCSGLPFPSPMHESEK